MPELKILNPLIPRFTFDTENAVPTSAHAHQHTVQKTYYGLLTYFDTLLLHIFLKSSIAIFCVASYQKFFEQQSLQSRQFLQYCVKQSTSERRYVGTMVRNLLMIYSNLHFSINQINIRKPFKNYNVNDPYIKQFPCYQLKP